MGVIYKNGVAYSGDTAEMTGATSSAAGTSGLVPAPSAGDITKFLRGDGTWVTPDGKYLIQSGTATTNGDSGGTAHVSYPKTYKTAPAVVAIANTAGVVCSISTLHFGYVVFQAYDPKNAKYASATINWIAIGEV